MSGRIRRGVIRIDRDPDTGRFLFPDTDETMTALRQLRAGTVARVDGRKIHPRCQWTDLSGWFDREIAGCSLADRRLTRRLRSLLERMGDTMGASIPLACRDWANTTAA